MQYVGVSGISHDCQHAIMRFFQYGDRIDHARILTCDGKNKVVFHAFFLSVEGDPVIVKSGFASGYGGGGPHAFSFILALLHAHDVEVDEIEVSPELFRRVDASALTRKDLARIEKAKAVHPYRWPNYVFEKHWAKGIEGQRLEHLWRDFPDVIPYSIIDERIADLAMTFHKNSDHHLLTGYRRLETIIRERTGFTEHGVKLFSRAFSLPKPKLSWKRVDPSEHAGRVELFKSIYQVYRNPRAHRERKHYSVPLSEFLLLNQLFLLEREAVGGRRLSSHLSCRQPASRTTKAAATQQ